MCSGSLAWKQREACVCDRARDDIEANTQADARQLMRSNVYMMCLFAVQGIFLPPAPGKPCVPYRWRQASQI